MKEKWFDLADKISKSPLSYDEDIKWYGRDDCWMKGLKPHIISALVDRYGDQAKDPKIFANIPDSELLKTRRLGEVGVSTLRLHLLGRSVVFNYAAEMQGKIRNEIFKKKSIITKLEENLNKKRLQLRLLEAQLKNLEENF